MRREDMIRVAEKDFESDQTDDLDDTPYIERPDFQNMSKADLREYLIIHSIMTPEEIDEFEDDNRQDQMEDEDDRPVMALWT